MKNPKPFSIHQNKLNIIKQEGYRIFPVLRRIFSRDQASAVIGELIMAMIYGFLTISLNELWFVVKTPRSKVKI